MKIETEQEDNHSNLRKHLSMKGIKGLSKSDEDDLDELLD